MINIELISRILEKIGSSPAPIIFYDTETTGLSTKMDRIVSMSAVKISTCGNVEHKSIVVNPTIPIPIQASNVHGITDDVARNNPPFKSYAQSMHKWFDGCILAGYNIDSYDTPLVRHEFHRCGIDFNPKHSLDVLSIEKKIGKSGKLFEVYNRYTGKDLKDAHNADADNFATMEIFNMMCSGHFSQHSIEQIISSFMDNRNFLDIDKKFYLDEQGKLRWNVNPKRDMIVSRGDNFNTWFLSKDFSENSKEVLRKYLQG